MSLTSLTTGISDYATRRAIQQLASKLNYDASPTFAGLTINGESISDALITQWSTAYSWGDHAGLYDAIGTAEGEVGDHESTYDHSLLHSPVTLDALTGITLTGQQLSYTAGYAIPTTAKQAEWDSAYTHKTTEDAINGLVSCDGAGTYTAKVIGTDVQAYDADLTAISALTPTDGNIIVGDGSTWVAESGATARTSIGVGTTDSPTFAGLTINAAQDLAFAGHAINKEFYLGAYVHSDVAGDAPLFYVAHFRGTQATPTTTQTGDELGGFAFQGYSTTKGGGANAAFIRAFADGEWDTGGDASDTPGRISFYTVPNGSSAAVEGVRLDSAGNVGINYTAGTHKLSVNGTCAFGDGGTTNYAEFEADGTLKFNGAATVWNDVNVGATALSLPVASQPDEVNFLDNTGADTGITTWGFAVGEKVSGAIDIPHDYKTGSNFTPHVHFQIIGAPAGGTDKAKWQIIYGKGRTGSTLAPATTITKELDVTTQYGFYRADFGAVDGTNWVLGDQFIFSLSRVAASSDEYAGDLLIATVGLHYECDTVGSRSITTK